MPRIRLWRRFNFGRLRIVIGRLSIGRPLVIGLGVVRLRRDVGRSLFIGRSLFAGLWRLIRRNLLVERALFIGLRFVRLQGLFRLGLFSRRIGLLIRCRLLVGRRLFIGLQRFIRRRRLIGLGRLIRRRHNLLV